ncbi:Acetyltransferase (Isoleucine patch superfamily) [Methanoculleus bourgensis]|uniref:Acetyltransferase (Isoleucine patch superfamily) n=2 Tax=Methanoculleus bourgensis TaxID=83986 RepID=A0A0X3BJX5_9EURY|nr:Acetyltransferase (Isoleucine patch superfamily) [Methanoculleus bourgensis]
MLGPKKLHRIAGIIRSMQSQVLKKLSPAPINATLAPTAQIDPEGCVENLKGDTACIRVGEHTYIRGRLFTYAHGGEITIGDWCYVGTRSEIWSMNSIRIGNRVLISHDVNIHDGTAHSLDPDERHAHFRQIMESGHPKHAEDLPGVRSSPIVIEDDVWISFGVIILQGVRIGKGSVIAAGSIVTHDVPAGVLYYNKINPVIKPLTMGEAP